MKFYIKTYINYFQYLESEPIFCEVCGCVGVDVHHIKYLSRGGTNNIENLICLCRFHHDMAHNEKLKADYLQDIHERFMQ